MEDFCILIELDEKGFSTRWHGEGSDGFETFAETLCAVTIDNAMFFALRRSISDVMKQHAGGLTPQNVPVVLLFHKEMSDEDKANIAALFSAAGFVAVKTLHYGKVLSDVFGKGNIVVLESDGRNLSVVIIKGDGTILSSDYLEGLGENPDVEYAADLLWDSIGYDAYFFNKDNEKAALTQFASKFLDSGRYEINDYIILSDGMRHSCFLSRHDIESRKSDNGLVRELVRLLDKAGVLSAECTLFLSNGATGEYYQAEFQNMGFKAITVKNAAFDTVVGQYILALANEVRDNNITKKEAKDIQDFDANKLKKRESHEPASQQRKDSKSEDCNDARMHSVETVILNPENCKLQAIFDDAYDRKDWSELVRLYDEHSFLKGNGENNKRIQFARRQIQQQRNRRPSESTKANSNYKKNKDIVRPASRHTQYDATDDQKKISDNIEEQSTIQGVSSDSATKNKRFFPKPKQHNNKSK